MPGAAAWAQKKGPFRLTASAALTSSSVVSANAAATKLAAELTSTSMPPERPLGLGHHAPALRRPRRGRRATVTARTPAPGSRPPSARPRRPTSGSAPPRRAPCRRAQAERPAHPHRAAGDQRPAARQRRAHPRPSIAAMRRVARPRWEMAAFSSRRHLGHRALLALGQEDRVVAEAARAAHRRRDRRPGRCRSTTSMRAVGRRARRARRRTRRARSVDALELLAAGGGSCRRRWRPARRSGR